MENLSSTLVIDSIFNASAEAIVIPHSTAGTITDGFRNELEKLRIPINIPTHANLGDVSYVAVLQSQNNKFKYIAYACTVHEQTSTYSSIRKVGKQLAELMPANIRFLASPLIGTGAGGLDPGYCYYILVKAFEEYRTLDGSELMIYSLDAANKQSIQNLSNFSDKKSNIIAFYGASISVSKLGYNKRVLESKEFHLQYAVDKYKEFEKHSGSVQFYNTILKRFKKDELPFNDFVNQFQPSSKEYSFLLIVGQLIAYIDSNAANKKDWNQYSDQRTMARSNVRQNVWVDGLIKYKINGHNYLGISPSVEHAIQFLQNPGDQLMMLSDNHRKEFSWNILELNYNSETFHRDAFTTFKKMGIEANNVLNNGVLYTRILYTHEVQELWLLSEDNKEAVGSQVQGRGQRSRKFRPSETGTQSVGTRPNSREESAKTLKPIIHSDIYATEDSLNFQLYAKAIVKFLTLRETRPPLTIGIMAPWGKGKTTLMRFIIEKLKFERSSQAANFRENDKDLKYVVREKIVSSYKSMLQTIKELRQGNIEHLKKTVALKKLEYPTVWFNAWKFQKEEQIWAGFAHEIINQLVNQLDSDIEREKFWLYLNLKRVDAEKIRNRIHFKLIRGILPLLLTCLSIIITLAIVSVFYTIILYYLLPVFAGSIITILTKLKSLKSKAPDIDVSKYIKQPAYSEKMGTLYNVEQDLVNVFNLLIDSEKPAIIFVDDLDRCSPTTISELVESINLFISGDLPDCYFVLGQDAEMVAAALDVEYEKIGEKINNVDRQHGSMGWYFMEKFIQLQFNIPTITDDQRSRFLRKLISENTPNANGAETVSKIQEIKELVRTADISVLSSSSIVTLRQEIKSSAPEAIAEINEQILDRAATEFNDNNTEVEQLVEDFSHFLGNSPRTIKRFVNLYRFYRFIQSSGVNDELVELENIDLAKWTILMIRWPQLIRAIQWNSEENFLDTGTSTEKASEIQNLYAKAENYTSWKQMIVANKWKVPCLYDVQLFEFMKTLTETSALKNAFKFGIW